GESVLFQITNVTTGNVYTPPWSVVDGSADDLDGATDGHIQTGWLVPQDALNTTLQVNAMGETSGLTAENTFTDAPKPTVTITATDGSASETGSSTGTFTVSRGTDTTGNLNVN